MQMCMCCMYYMVHSLANLSRAIIHFRTHAHPIPKGNYKMSFKEMKNMVTKEVLHMPNVTSFTITLVASKTLLFVIFSMKIMVGKVL